MAKFESENRRVAWFENSVHPAFRKAKDELPTSPDQPAGPKPEPMLTPFNLPRFKPGPSTPGDPMDPYNPPSPVEVGNHVIGQLKARGMPHDPSMIRRTVNHLIKNVDHPDLVFHPEKGSVIAAQDNTGWKLRLNTGRDLVSEPDDFDHHIMKFLASQGYGGYANIGGTKANRLKIPLAPGVERMGSFKRGSGGEQWPEQGIYQNYTIYTGGRKPTQALAEKLERNFGEHLQTGMEGTEAMLTPHVGARFVYDNGVKGVNNMPDDQRLEYHTGATIRGVPLPIGYDLLMDQKISMDDAVRSHDLLWSILSPEYYGPAVHQQVRKSMEKFESENRGVSWFSVSIAPELRKATVAEQMFPFQKPRGLHMGVMAQQGRLQANGNPFGHLDVDEDESAPGNSHSQGFQERATHYIPNAYHSDPAQRGSQDFDDPRGRMLIARGPRGELQNSAYAMDALRDTGVVPKMHGYDLRDTHDQHVVTESLGHNGYAPMTVPDDSDEETPGLRRIHPDAEKHLGRIDPMQLARSAYGSLSKIHDAGYTHGNVGPESLWMNKDGHVKFTHLGDTRKGADDTVRQNDIFGMLKTINDHHPYSNDFYEKINNHVQGSPDDWHSPEKMKAFLGTGGPQRQRLGPPAAPAAAPAAAPRPNYNVQRLDSAPAAPAAAPVIPKQAKPFDPDNMAPNVGSIRRSWFNVSLHNMFRKALPEERVIPQHREPENLGWSYDKHIGAGLAGTTHLYTSEDGKRRVIKRANMGFASDLSKEEQTLRKLQGIPGVPVLHGTGRNTGGRTSWIATDHAEDDGFMSLNSLLSRGDLPISGKKFRTIWFNGARLLDQIHEKGTDHGDLANKPEHVYVNPQTGQVKLIDFGNSTEDGVSDGKTDHKGLENLLAAFYRVKTRLDKSGLSTEDKLNAKVPFEREEVANDAQHFDLYHADADPFGKSVLDELDTRKKQRQLAQRNLTESLGSSIKDGTHSRLADREDVIQDGLPPAPKVTPPAPEVVPPAPEVTPPAPQVRQTPAPKGRLAPTEQAYTYVPPNEKTFDFSDSDELPQVTSAPAPQVRQTPAPQQTKPFDPDDMAPSVGSVRR